MSCNGQCCRETEVPSHPVQTKNVIHNSARCTQVVTLRAYEAGITEGNISGKVCSGRGRCPRV
jgi:hypothetical protein